MALPLFLYPRHVILCSGYVFRGQIANAKYPMISNVCLLILPDLSFPRRRESTLWQYLMRVDFRLRGNDRSEYISKLKPALIE